jgi:hypothetical protein
MRYRMTATVEGHIWLDQPIAAERDGVTYEFLADASGKLTHLAVSTQVDPAACEASYSRGGEGGVSAT